jgi:hypothetical protein
LPTQQYYVRKGLIVPLQDELFGDSFNMVGIVGRGASPAVQERIRHGPEIDWPDA